ncbi:type III polyketide synthase [Ferruginibacter yonginensis]|uniref:Type III polyketide synthase n=1 Tax=Ferruginibacter yonginensis TaxID=1310416 RepID=A0ABV8QQB9_9BACT
MKDYKNYTLSNIVSIATGVPAYKHLQKDLFNFADATFNSNEQDSRKLRFLYNQSGIAYRHSIIKDFCVPASERNFFSLEDGKTQVPDIAQRMALYNQFAAPLSVKVIEDCIAPFINKNDITHLITVSCTGMSAPGLDLQIMEAMDLPNNIVRTSINFMGCYAAIHGMRLADAFCKTNPNANVVVVCTEFCTLHFQSAYTVDNLTASLLFADGCAAFLMQAQHQHKGLQLQNFYAEVSFKGKKDMAWELSPTGFLMTLSGYIPELVKADFDKLVTNALQKSNLTKKDVTQWCVHPGGKKILQSIEDSMHLQNTALQFSYDVLNDYGNMSSPTILFVLKKILENLQQTNATNETIFGAAFGPGLTMETFTATYG